MKGMLTFSKVVSHVEEQEELEGIDFEDLDGDVQGDLIEDHISDLVDAEGIAEAAVDFNVREANRDITDNRGLQDHLIEDTIRNSVKEDELYDIRGDLNDVEDGLAREISDELIDETEDNVDEEKSRYSMYECRIVGEIVAEDEDRLRVDF